MSMKTITALVLFALLGFSARSQNYAVLIWGTNNQGYPQFYPRAAQPIGTNTTAEPGWLVVTTDQLNTIIRTNLQAYNAALSNNVYLSQQRENAALEKLSLSYSNLQWCADNWESATNLAALKIAVKAEGDVLLKLRPILQAIYKGNE